MERRIPGAAREEEEEDGHPALESNHATPCSFLPGFFVPENGSRAVHTLVTLSRTIAGGVNNAFNV